MTNSMIEVPNPVNNEEWQSIVEQIIETTGLNDAPEKVIEATEMLISGFTTSEIAKKLGVSRSTVKEWMTYEPVAKAVALGKELLIKWRMGQLEKQFLQAVKRSEEILNLDFYDKEVNTRLVAQIAQQSRFIIEMFLGKRVDVSVNMPSEAVPLLKASADALGYIAQELAKIEKAEEIIEGNYEVIPPPPKEPMVKEDGNPYYGEYGVADINEDGFLCHICGARVKRITAHVSERHKISARDYELAFLLELGTLEEYEKSIA